MRMNTTYLPTRDYNGNKEYCFLEDNTFQENVLKSLKPFLKERSSSIRQCITDKDKIFVYLDRPNAIVELNDNGKFIRELKFFREMKDFAYGCIALNDSSVFIEDYRGPPNMYTAESIESNDLLKKKRFIKFKSNKIEIFSGFTEFKEQYVNEIRLYAFSLGEQLNEIGILKYSVDDLIFDKTGRFFGLCNKLYGEKCEKMKIVELYRDREIPPKSLEDEFSRDLIENANPKPRAYHWSMNELHEIYHFQLQPLIKTPDGNVFHYNDETMKTYCLTQPREGFLYSEDQHSSQFVFLDDFVVSMKHKHYGKEIPHKKMFSFIGESYESSPNPFFYSTPFLEQSTGYIFEPLSNNSFIIDWIPWKWGINPKTQREDFIEWGPHTLRKFRVETATSS